MQIGVEEIAFSGGVIAILGLFVALPVRWYQICKKKRLFGLLEEIKRMRDRGRKIRR